MSIRRVWFGGDLRCGVRGSSPTFAFANAISDGRMFAYIPFVEVHPEHRGQGIGTALMRAMLDVLDEMYGVDLSCDPELVPFYERVGLQPVVAMVRRNNDRV